MSEEEIIKKINYVTENWYDENLEIDCRWIEKRKVQKYWEEKAKYYNRFF